MVNRFSFGLIVARNMVVIASQKYQGRKSHTTTDFGISPPTRPHPAAGSQRKPASSLFWQDVYYSGLASAMRFASCWAAVSTDSFVAEPKAFSKSAPTASGISTLTTARLLLVFEMAFTT